ncbi:YtxH domain-containing protein [Streptacidiphilus cavernicola]|uniref:YtxH domain-containing protein n=1 Tax=Streptacidiphilus cavernicola TaxID=3342716 RepID=A0ABV6VRL9_9ACTN
MRKLTFIAGLALGYVLGTRAGRERYEQLSKAAHDLAQAPTVQSATRNAKQAAGTAAGKAADAVVGKVGDRIPSSVTDRVPYLRDRVGAESTDAWGSSTR